MPPRHTERVPRTRTSERRGPEPPPTVPATPRRPQQERGQRRVDAILDATAALIAEEGLAGVTMHGVARRSGTTTGSMYHFFPDRVALLRALAERHTRALRTVMARVERDDAEQWARLSTADAVRRFLEPFLTYIDAHPDLLPVMRFARTSGWVGDRDAELDRSVLRLAEAVLASRDPSATPGVLMVRALTMTAMTEGMVGAEARVATSSRAALSVTALRRELQRALVAYVDSYATPRKRHA